MLDECGVVELNSATAVEAPLPAETVLQLRRVRVVCDDEVVPLRVVEGEEVSADSHDADLGFEGLASELRGVLPSTFSLCFIVPSTLSLCFLVERDLLQLSHVRRLE